MLVYGKLSQFLCLLMHSDIFVFFISFFPNDLLAWGVYLLVYLLYSISFYSIQIEFKEITEIWRNNSRNWMEEKFLTFSFEFLIIIIFYIQFKGWWYFCLSWELRFVSWYCGWLNFKAFESPRVNKSFLESLSQCANSFRGVSIRFHTADWDHYRTSSDGEQWRTSLINSRTHNISRTQSNMRKYLRFLSNKT